MKPGIDQVTRKTPAHDHKQSTSSNAVCSSTKKKNKTKTKQKYNTSCTKLHILFAHIQMLTSVWVKSEKVWWMLSANSSSSSGPDNRGIKHVWPHTHAHAQTHAHTQILCSLAAIHSVVIFLIIKLTSCCESTRGIWPQSLCQHNLPEIIIPMAVTPSNSHCYLVP